MSREAMQVALEALESDPISHAGIVSRKQAIAALRQALETDLARVGEVGVWGEWQGLTDEEVSDVIDDVLEGGGWLDVARAIEQALKEKNHG